MASREKGRATQRDSVDRDDQLTARFIEDDIQQDAPSIGDAFPRFAATSRRLAELERGRTERFMAARSENPAPAAPMTTSPSELTRLTDRLVEAREQLEVQRVLAGQSAQEVLSLQQRLVAARALVMEAQRTAQLANERCAFVEGRCESLELALDIAVNASPWKRMMWRRGRRSVG